MAVSIVVALMVVLIGAFWAYQGFFSAAVMFFESLVAAMLAFGFHESVHSLWAGSLGEGIGLPLAFMLIFVLTMVLMHLLTDRLVPGAVQFSMYVDRAGGAVCGFLAGMVVVGSALVAVQMLPIGAGVFGFQRLQVNQDGLPVEKGLGLWQPDAFVVGLADMCSSGRFGGGNRLGVAKPDMLLGLYSARAAPQTEARFVVPADSLRVVSCRNARQVSHVRQKVLGADLVREFTEHDPAEPASKFLVCRVQLGASAGQEGTTGEIHFRVPQFRVVGPPPGAGGRNARPRLYLACGMSDIYTHRQHNWPEVKEGQAARLVRFSPLTDFVLSPSATKAVATLSDPNELSSIKHYEFEVAFEVPEDFEPWYVEFKHGARAEVTKQMRVSEAPAPAGPALGALQSSSGTIKVGAPAAGIAHVADAIQERTGATALLPLPLDRSDPMVARHLRGGRLDEGHFWVVVKDEKDIAAGSKVTEFLVPGDKRIVQIGAERVMAGSTYGKALNYAARVAGQIMVMSSDGQMYFAQGVYSAAPIGNELVFEIQYWPTTDVSERCLREAMKVTKNIIESAKPSDRKFGYIFLVDPGAKITSFSTGAAGESQRLDIDVPG